MRDFRPCIHPKECKGMTCTVVACEELGFGTRGPKRRYLLLGCNKLYTVVVNNVRVSGYEVIETPV